jgi:hypothetical protein
MWDKRKENLDLHNKFDGLWIGPYKIESKVIINYFYLAILDGEKFPFPVNGQLCNIYFAINT